MGIGKPAALVVVYVAVGEFIAPVPHGKVGHDLLIVGICLEVACALV